MVVAVASSAMVSLGCGSGNQRTTPDESRDLDPTSGGSHGTASIPQGLDGTTWRWVEAHCTEGPLDLASRGFAQELSVAADGDALVLTYDQTVASEQCSRTILQRVSPPDGSGELRVEEVARISVPSSDACFGRPEQPRPGEVRRAGQRLEVLVQRSNWCGGFEVRMVFEPARWEALTDEEIVRRYALYFARGDAEQMARLFAETGSVLEPFTQTETGDPYRHDGRGAVRDYYRDTFAGTAWRAMRIVSIAPGEQAHTTTVEWEYMDPRLAHPLRGRNRFTTAAGEIFEAQIELLDTPVLAPAPTAPVPSDGEASESATGG
jgi:hypothetical protein